MGGRRSPQDSPARAHLPNRPGDHVPRFCPQRVPHRRRELLQRHGGRTAPRITQQGQGSHQRAPQRGRQAQARQPPFQRVEPPSLGPFRQGRLEALIERHAHRQPDGEQPLTTRAAGCIYYPLSAGSPAHLTAVTEELLRWLLTCGSGATGVAKICRSGESVEI